MSIADIKALSDEKRTKDTLAKTNRESAATLTPNASALYRAKENKLERLGKTKAGTPVISGLDSYYKQYSDAVKTEKDADSLYSRLSGLSASNEYLKKDVEGMRSKYGDEWADAQLSNLSSIKRSIKDAEFSRLVGEYEKAVEYNASLYDGDVYNENNAYSLEKLKADAEAFGRNAHEWYDYVESRRTEKGDEWADSARAFIDRAGKFYGSAWKNYASLMDGAQTLTAGGAYESDAERYAAQNKAYRDALYSSKYKDHTYDELMSAKSDLFRNEKKNDTSTPLPYEIYNTTAKGDSVSSLLKTNAKPKLDLSARVGISDEEAKRELDWINEHKSDITYLLGADDETIDRVRRGMEAENETLKNERNRLASEIRGIKDPTESEREKIKEYEKRIKEIDDRVEYGILGYTDDGIAVTFDNIKAINRADTTLADIERSEEQKRAFEKAQMRNNELEMINEIARVTSEPTFIVKNNEKKKKLDETELDVGEDEVQFYSSFASAESAFDLLTPEQKDLCEYISKTYGIHIVNGGRFDVAELERARRRLFEEKNAAVSRFEAYGYDFGELDYYLDLKEDIKESAKRAEEDAAWAKEHPVLSTISTLYRAPLTVFDYADNLIDSSKGIGRENSIYGVSNVYDDNFINRNNTYLGAVSESIYDSVKDTTDSTTLAWLASTAYSGVTSATQSAMTTAVCVTLFGPALGSKVALGVMGAEAASSSYNNAVKNGSSNLEALLTSMAAGTAEVLFEKLPMDNLIKLGRGMNASEMSGLLKKALYASSGAFKQALTEAGEEFGTEIVNLLADELINGDHSSYANNVKKLMTDGYTYDEARQKASEEVVLGVLSSAIGGFIGGASSGSVGSIVGLSQLLSDNSSERDMLDTLTSREFAEAESESFELLRELAASDKKVAGVTLAGYVDEYSALRDEVTDTGLKDAISEKISALSEFALENGIPLATQTKNIKTTADISPNVPIDAFLDGATLHTKQKGGKKTTALRRAYSLVSAVPESVDGILSLFERTGANVKNIIEDQTSWYLQSYTKHISQTEFANIDSTLGYHYAQEKARGIVTDEYVRTQVAAQYLASVIAKGGFSKSAFDISASDPMTVQRLVNIASGAYHKSAAKSLVRRANRLSEIETVAGKITEMMTEAERYEALKNRKLQVAQVNQENAIKIAETSPELIDKTLKKSNALRLIKRLGEEFGVFKQYQNSDIDIKFEFGKNNLAESLTKQKGNYDLYAHMLSCFDEVVENAIGIEVHNRNQDGYIPDPTLNKVYVLCSAFENEDGIIPCKLSVKEFNDKTNRLYVAVALESIKKDRVVSMGVPNTRSHVRTSPVTISIRDLFANVNSRDVDFLKYIPDKFLSEEQIAAKSEQKNNSNTSYNTKTSKSHTSANLNGRITIDGEVSKTKNNFKGSLPDERIFIDENLKKSFRGVAEDGRKIYESNFPFMLKAYTDKQKENWVGSKRIVLYENEKQFREFINESLNNKQYNKKMYFGAVSSELAELIRNKTGIEAEGYNVSLSSNEIRKIIKDHGDENKELPRGQRAVTADDFLNIPKVIQSPDEIRKGQKDYDGKPVILFDKVFKGQFTVVAVVSDKHLDIRVQTSYIGIKKGNLATPVDASSPAFTSETSRGTVSDIIIPHLQGKVNINVKEKSNGDYVYRFNAEKKSSTRRTLHAGVSTVKGANGELFLDNNISQDTFVVNSNDMQNKEKYTEKISGQSVISENGHGTPYQTADGSSVTHPGEKVNTKTSKSHTSANLNGRITIDGEVSKLTDVQLDSIDGIGVLARALGLNVHIYNSSVIDGERYIVNSDGEVIKSPNGWYDTNDGSIHIDVNAGGRGTMLFTMSHELTHFIRDWSRQKYEKLERYVRAFHEEDGRSIDELKNEQIELARQNGIAITDDVAMEEVVATTLEGMLSDGSIIEHVANIRKIDTTLGDKIKSKISELIRKIKDAYARIPARTSNSTFLSETEEALAELQALFEDALLNASDNYTRAENKKASGEGKRYSIKYPKYSKAEIESNIKQLSKMSSVYDVSAEKLKKTGVSPKEQFRQYFKSLNENIYTEEFGDVSLRNSSVKSEIRHGITAEKTASIEAIPAVLEKGKVVFSKSKETDTERIVVAAPIKIGDTTYFMGVMLQRNSQNQRLYLHNVVIEKETSFPSQTDSLTNWALEENESLYMTSILQNVLRVKNQYMQNSGNYTRAENKKASGDGGVIYDVGYTTDNKPVALNIKKVDMRSPSNSNNAKNSSNISTNNNVSQDTSVVNSNYMKNGGNYTRAKNIKASGEETDKKKYDLDESLGIQLYDWLYGQGKKYGSYNGEFFKLGTTPTIFTKHGAPSVELIMYDDVITKVTGGKHNISLDEIAKLPSQLNDPILLFSGSVPNSFVALTELVDKLGNDVIVAVHINKHYSRNVVNKIASLYSKSDNNGNNRIIDYIKRQINEQNLIDASNNKASNWFTTRGLQLPKVVQTILDANKRISQKDPVVNIDDMQYGDDYTQKEKQKASGEDKRYSIKYPKYSKADIESNIKELAKMASVYNVSAEKLKKTGKRPREMYEEFFALNNNNIYVEEFGDIELSKASVREEIRHGVPPEKIASIEAIPAVLKNGKVVFFKNKETDTERIVVCAPVTIGNTPYFMGVMLQRNSQNKRLYLHNVVIEKETSLSSQTDLVTTGALEENESLSMTSILQNALLVKNQYNVVIEKEASSSSQADSLTNWALEENDTLFITSILQKVLHVKNQYMQNGGNYTRAEKKRSSTEGGVIYDVGYTTDNKPVALNIKKVDMHMPSNSNNAKNSSDISTNNNISQDTSVVNSKYMKNGGNYTRGEKKKVSEEETKASAANSSGETGVGILSQSFIDKTLRSFAIKSPGDFIHVQRQVFGTLVDEGFFTDEEARSRTDVNEETGMEIETNKSGIYETFDRDNYGIRGRNIKFIKLATVRQLPEIIKNGTLIEDNVLNSHNNSSNVSFSYIEHEIDVDGTPVTIKVSVKKTPQKNKLWVHSVYTEKISGPDAISKNGNEAPYQTADGSSVTYPGEKVNTKNKNSHASVTLRADEVYKQRTDLAVGDKVGAVTLVADLDTGKPVTPKLRVEFDREDMSSYILATIESLGDKELVGAFEDELAILLMDSDADLPMLDAVDILSEYVRDGSITPEQAAQILSKELSDPTGADIPTLVERATYGDGVGDSLGSSAYSYDALTKKQDVSVTMLPYDIPRTAEGKIDRKTIISLGRFNARSQNNERNTPTETYVYVPDIDVDVLIRKDGLEHGLSRDDDTALATIKIGDLLKNSIAVNELNGRTNGKRSTDMAYVLLSIGENKNSPYLVRTIVDKTTNAVMEISTYGLYAIKAKKEGALFMPEGNEAVGDNRSYPFLRSTISIADLLESVKNEPIANEIFSNDVLEKIGATRTEGTLSPDIRYSFAEPNGGDGVKYSLENSKIVRNMPSSKRYQILSKKYFTEIPSVAKLSTGILEKVKDISSWEDINAFQGKEKRELIMKIADEFGVFKTLKNTDIELHFEFSKNNYRESFNKQKRQYEHFAKMFSVFDKVIAQAIGIEVHNKNDIGYKPDPTLENVYVLLSAFEDGDYIVPVKLEIKEFKDKENKLYVAIALDKIKKTGVSEQGTTENGVAQDSRPVKITITDLMQKVNPHQLEIKEFNDKENKLYVANALDKIKKTGVWKQGTTENGVAQDSRPVKIIITDLMKKVNPLQTSFTKYFPNEVLTNEQKQVLIEQGIYNSDTGIPRSISEPDGGDGVRYSLGDTSIDIKDISTYITKKESNTVTQALDVNTSSSTSETELASPDIASGKRVSQSETDVNSHYMRNHKRYSLEEYNKPITAADVDVLKSIDKINGKPKSVSQFTSEDIEKTQKWAYKFYKEIGTKSPFFRAWFGDWREYDSSKTTIVSTEGALRGNTRNEDTDWNIIISRQVHKETTHHSSEKVKTAVRYLPYIEQITKNAVLLDSYISEKDNNLSAMFHSFYAYTEMFGYPALLKLQVEELINEKTGNALSRDYILQNIKEEPISKSRRFSKAHHSETDSSTISVSDLFELVKENDKDFHYRPVDPVLLNSDGTPKVFYHGATEDLTAFDSDQIASDEGSFLFFENREEAQAYGENVFEVYLQGRKLADYDDQPSEFYRLNDKHSQAEYLKDKGYDGWYRDMDSDGWGEVSVFSPGQIKSAAEFVDILYELGYTESEIENYKKRVGITNDEQRNVSEFDRSVAIRHDSRGRRGTATSGLPNNSRGQARGVSGRQEPLGRSDTGTERTGIRKYDLGISSSLAEPDGGGVVEYSNEDVDVNTNDKSLYNKNKDGGITNGSQDPERVAGRALSTARRSNDVLREQSNDSAGLSVRMGDGGIGSEILDVERQGSSGRHGEPGRKTVQSLSGVHGSVRRTELNGYNKDGGITNGSQDSERVAGRALSTARRSNDVLRKQSNDSGKMSVRVGNSRSGNQGDVVERYGSSGWLGRSQGLANSSIQSLLGDIRVKELSLIDSIGRSAGDESENADAKTRKRKADNKVSRVYSHTVAALYAQAEKDNVAELEDSIYSYNVLHERDSIRAAKTRLESRYEYEKEYLSQKEYWSGEDLDVAMGIETRERQAAIESGDYKEAAKWIKLIQEHGTSAGKFIQSFAKYTRTPSGIVARIINKLKTVEGYTDDDIARILPKLTQSAALLESVSYGDVEGIKNTIREFAKTRNTKIGDKHFYTRLSQALDEVNDFEFLNKLATAQLENMATDNMEPSVFKKLSSFQTMAQLLTLKTYERNVVSNAAMEVMEALATNNLGYVVDRVIGTFTKVNTVGLQSTRWKKTARAAAAEGRYRATLEVGLDARVRDSYDDIVGGGERNRKKTNEKYYNTYKRTWSAASGNPLIRGLSTAEKLLGYSLNVTDAKHKAGVEKEVYDSLSFAVEKGYISDSEARRIAKSEAEYRAFQNSNVVSDMLYDLKQSANRIGTKDFGLGDLVQKYTQVPGALISRVIEYSPVGYAKAVYNFIELCRAGANVDTMSAKKREALFSAQRNFALQFARSTTGTALIAVCAALARLGLFGYSDDDEDDDRAAFERDQGLDGLQVNFSAFGRFLLGDDSSWREGDMLVDLGFLEPLDAIASIGVALDNTAQKEGLSLGGYIGEGIEETLDALVRSISDIPTMQTISSVYDSWKYSDADNVGGKIIDCAVTFAASSVTGLMPNIVSQFANAADSYYRDTYADNETETLLRKIAYKIPGIRNLLPKSQNAWGEEREYTNSVAHAIGAVLFPGNVNELKTDDVEAEINRLADLAYQTDGVDIIPDRSVRSALTIAGCEYTLSERDKVEFAAMRGQVAYALYAEIITSEIYKAVSDSERVLMLDLAKEYANYVATKNYAEKNGIDYKNSAKEKIENRLSSGAVDNFAIEAYKNLIQGDGEAQSISSIVNDTALDNNVKLQLIYALTTTYDKDTGNVDREKYDNIVNACNAGAPLTLVSKFLNYCDSIQSSVDQSGRTVYTDIDGVSARRKTELCERWLETTRMDVDERGNFVRVTDEIRYYLYALQYPSERTNPFR